MPRTRKPKPRVEDAGSVQHLVLLDCMEEDGWADSQQVADKLDLLSRRLASSRLSWLARWGIVEREHKRDESGNIRYHRDGRPMHTQRWRPTPVGHDLATGALRKAQASALENARDHEIALLSRELAARHRTMPFAVSKMMTREWRWGIEHQNGSR
jgi:hypothetical protein